MTMTRFTTLVIILFLVNACGTGYKFKQSESIQSKMERYKNKHDNMGKMPKLNVFNINSKAFKKYGQSRFPASNEKSSKISQNETINIYGNKKTYFLTLLSQYEILASYNNNLNQIKICPSFHSSIIEYRTKNRYSSDGTKHLKINFSMDSNKWTSEYLALYPEMSLPISMDSIRPTIHDKIKKSGTKNSKEILSNAIKIHTHKLRKELKYLCEHGQSSNYYKFENLVTEIYQHQNFGPSKKNTEILFKTTIFSNMALINSLKYKGKGRSIASSQTVGASNQLIDHLNIHWVRTYMREMNRLKMSAETR